LEFELTFDDRGKSSKAILLSAKKLIWKYGISRVTVEEICKEAGVSKMTFYRNFENKFEVAKIVLVEFTELSYQNFARIFNQKIPFPDILSQFLALKREQAKAVSLEFIKDLYTQNDFNKSLLGLLEASQKKMMGIVIHSMEEAKKDGSIREEISVPFILYMFDKVGHMVEDENLISLFKDSEEMTIVITNFLFKGFLSDKKE
jgi:AcrR family transcriptional regulator